MTYEQVSAQLRNVALASGSHVHVVEGNEVDTTALYFPPARWFIAFKPAGRLYTGIYEGPERRLSGTDNFAFEDLTESSLKNEIDKAMAEQVGQMLDPETVKEFFKKFPPKHGQRNKGPENFGGR